MDRFIQDIAKKAGNAVLKRFGKDGELYRKTRHRITVVTKADLLADKLITQAIRKKYPEHGIISEEGGSKGANADYVWVIDPIDGTMNFSAGVPMFGVMICLVHRGEVVLSVINMPATGEFFFAKAGKGSFLNGKRIHCSKTSTLKWSSGYGASTLQKRSRKLMFNLLKSPQHDTLTVGSFSCCANQAYVAAGRRDWTISLSGQIWDFAPVALLLQEAGCKVTDTRGRPWKFGILEIVAANPALHKQLLKLTKNV
jgi:myo-inositol-1(or 4)-monophosphatase